MQWQASIGTVKTGLEARLGLTGLMEVIGGRQLPAGEALRAFFVSPDVSEFFRYTYKMNRTTFLNLVNSFLRTDIHVSLLDAFLMVCHDVGDLFTLHYDGRISVGTEGWELVDEMPVAGPKRSIRPVKPVGQDDLEKWFVKRKADFIDNNTRRRIVLASDLGDIVRRYFPQLTPDTFMDSMHFFSQVGRLYNM